MDAKLLRLGVFADGLRSRLGILPQARKTTRQVVMISAFFTVLIAPASLVPWRLVPQCFAADDTQPAPIPSDLNGRVLTADGRPVSGATVFVALPGPSSIRIRNGRVDFANSDAQHIVTGADGEYLLPPQPGKFLLQVVADVGFGQAD